MASLLLLGLVSEAAQSKGKSPFKISWEKGAIGISSGETLETKIKMSCPSDHYLYKDQSYLDFKVLEGLRVKEIRYPNPVSHFDPFTNKDIPIYKCDIEINVALSLPQSIKPGKRTVAALLTYVGCSPKVCYRETTVPISWEIAVGSATVRHEEGIKVFKEEGPEARPTIKEMLHTRDFGRVLGYGYIWAFVIAFLGGLLTSLTPCILPIIPVTLLVIGVQKKGSLLHNLLLSILFTLGIVFTYSILGLFAAAIGLNLGFLFQEKLFLVFVVAFFVVMSLSMFGLFEIQLPVGLRGWLSRLGGRGILGSFVAGISVGLLAAPCVGPVIGPLLLFVASTKSLNLGFWLLFTYSIGMGLLIVIIGTFYGTLAGKVHGGRLGVVIKRVLAVLLLIPALYYGSLLMPQKVDIKSLKVEGAIEWVFDETDALRLAVSKGRPVIIDFYADWCLPCKVLDANVFGDAAVVKRSKSFVALHVNATVKTDEVKRLIDEYDIIGWPTVVFLSPDGKLHSDLTLSGDITKGELTASMDEALKRLREGE